ncbi:MAG: proline/glycine betaine ABC transporter ATP-binding protein ProV [Candidimonas sp.]|nr:MAG: proline/glycine betaine ABC transporter ATP-binding protein ProV [Candidimonas sp.]TAM18713.1 MAG: proline/glycine betaine ABC transporter ATP-binding protein ProV [Candidimonas sp.]
MKERLVVKSLYKVFGSRPERAMRLAREGADKAVIFEQTGQTLGVNNASFTVYEGETFVVMGLSGSGKSTLVRLLNRLIDPTAGQVLFDGIDISGMSERDLRELRRRHMSMVFQSFALMPHLTVLQNTGFGLELAGETRSVRDEKARKALEQVGLGASVDCYPHQLSGGMQQRVGLARALANNPSVLLMDEAFSALDPLIRAGMQDELVKLQRHDKRTIIFISHDIEEAFRIGDRIAIMEGGVVVQVGTAQEIVKQPANDYVRSFFKNVDVTRIFSALDVSSIPDDTVIELDEKNVRQALEQLVSCGHKHGFVVGNDRKFHGIVSVATLNAELQRSQNPSLKSACLPGTPSVASDTPVSHLYRFLADCLHDLPVVDTQGCYCGAVSKTRVLDFLGQRSAVSDRGAQSVSGTY